LGDPFVALPPVIAGEVDVIPAQRGNVREEGIVDLPVPPKGGDRAFEIDGVPEHDGRGDQIESAGPDCVDFRRRLARGSRKARVEVTGYRLMSAYYVT
jgi:hypothetical protein